MSRSYSQEFRIQLYKLDPANPGVALGIACVEANLPAKYVAAVLKISRMAIHGWFRGNALRTKNREAAEALTRIIKQDMEANVLPAKTVADAKAWLRGVIGEE